jgi:hypothetical protein
MSVLRYKKLQIIWSQSVRYLKYIGIIGLLAIASIGVSRAEVLLNPSFEVNNNGRIASDWSKQNINSATSGFFVEQRTDYVHQGASAQKIVFNKNGSENGVLQFHQLVSLDKGKLYRFSFWIRTDPNMTVNIRSHVRETGGVDLGGRYFNVTEDYQKVEFLVATSENDVSNIRCGIQVYDNAVLYIDNASLEEVTQEDSLAFNNLQLPTKIVPDEFFGIEYRQLNLHRDKFADINQGLVRIWGRYAGWGHIQPTEEEDVWNFSEIDSQLDYIETHLPGAKVLMKLGMAPSWATGVDNDPDVAWGGSEYSGANHMVIDTNDWVDYVEKVVSNYDGREGRREIHYYEIWNEVDHKKFWKGGMANMLTLAELAYNKIKQINPNAKVLLPNFTANGHLQLDEYLSLLSQTGSTFADLADLHIYYGDMTPELTINSALVFKEHLQRWGINLPVWNSEGSAKWDSTEPVPSSEEARGAVARGYILNWAYGHENFMWYNWGPAGEGYGLPLVEYDWETLSPAGEAYKNVAEWLTGARFTDSNIDDVGNYIVAIDNPAEMVRAYIVWRTSGTFDFTPDSNWGIRQWKTLAGSNNQYNGGSVTVGVEPVLFEAEHYLIPDQWYSLASEGYNNRLLQALGTGANNNVITAPPTTNGDWVRWRFVSAPDGSYYIENHEGRLQALGASANYNVVTALSTQTDNSVRWRLVPSDDSGQFYLQNALENRRLRADLSSGANPRFNVHTTSDRVTGDWVRWRFLPSS